MDSDSTTSEGLILHWGRKALSQGKTVFTETGEHQWEISPCMRSRPFSPSLPRQEAKETTEPSDEEGSLQRQEIQPHMEVPVATLNLEAVIIKTSRERIGMLGFHTQSNYCWT